MLRIINIILGFSLMAVSGPLYASEAQSSATLQPILPLDADVETIPFLDLALRDPVIDLRAANAKEAERLLATAAELEEQLEGVKNRKQRVKLVDEIFHHYLALVTYLEDIDHDLIEDRRVAKIETMRAKLVKYAGKLQTLTKDNNDKIQARYHIVVSKILAGKMTEAFSELGIDETEPMGRWSANVEFIRALAQLSSNEQEAGRARLTKAFPKLNAPAGIVAMLLIARSFAGLDDKGATYAEANQQYRKYLIAATKRAAYMSEPMRYEVFSYALGIWRGAEGGTENWDNPALAMTSFKDLDEVQAIEERLALKAAEKGNFADAARRYSRIIEAHQRVPELAPLTERLLNLQEAQAGKAKDAKLYGDALRTAERKFAFRDILGKDHAKTAQAFGQKFHERYRNYVDTNLNLALDKGTKPAARALALQLTNDYLNSRPRKDEERIDLSVKMAQVHSSAGEYVKAAEVYLDLSERTKGSEARKFLRLAIENQSLLAKWPTNPPWGKIPSGDIKARMVLASMYEDLNEYTRSQDWAVLAHIGLLRVSAGNSNEAYVLWLEALKDGQRGEDASHAAGWLMTAARSGKKWGDLVYIVYQVQTYKIVPTLNGKDLDPMQALADGLYHGGMSAFERQEFAVATKFLDGFVRQFNRDKRYVAALFHRGKAQSQTDDPKNATASMREIVTEYPSSKHMKDAVLEGMRIAPNDDDRMFFYEAYLKTFPKGEAVPTTRLALANLYLKAEDHVRAAKLFDAHAKDTKHVNAEGRLEASARVMELEEKYGSLDKARKASATVTSLARGNPAYVAKVIAFNTREASRKKRLDKMEGFEKQLLAFDSDQREVIEALAQVRYFIAVRDAGKPIAKVNPLNVKDPIKVIQDQVALYQSLRKGFERVCDLGVNEFCQAAKLGLTEMSQRSIDAIRDIRPPVTMDEKTVQGFETQKAQIMEIMSQTVGQDRLMGRN